MQTPYTPPSALLDQAKRIDNLLSETYGNPEWSPGLDAISELILTVLSQHTSDVNSGAAFDTLLEEFGGDWNRVMSAPTEQVASAIRSAGLSNIKAPRIQAILCEIERRTNSLDLQFIGELPIEEGRRWLTSLHGVGPKTAACVLIFSFGLPAMPVDTHVHRTSQRLGLIGPKVSAETAHERLAALVPAERVYAFHINLIRHGRQTCKAPAPRCHVCPLTELCDYYRSEVSNGAGQC